MAQVDPPIAKACLYYRWVGKFPVDEYRGSLHATRRYSCSFRLYRSQQIAHLGSTGTGVRSRQLTVELYFPVTPKRRNLNKNKIIGIVPAVE